MWKKSLMTLIFASLLAVVILVAAPTEAKADRDVVRDDAVAWLNDIGDRRVGFDVDGYWGIRPS